jgi:hypothetical protein
MRVAGGSAIRRYFNEELVWVEPQNMPQALYLQLLGFLIYKGITEGERRMEQQAMQDALPLPIRMKIKFSSFVLSPPFPDLCKEKPLLSKRAINNNSPHLSE